MTILTFLIFAFIISLVPFSVGLSSSVYRCIEWKEAIRMALVIALFHSLAAGLGWGLGFALKGWFNDMKVPVALLVMLFIGFRLFMDSRRIGRELRTVTTGNANILAGFAFVTSINTALLGISLGMIYSGVLHLAGLLLALVFLMVIAGIRAGKMGMMNLGRSAETIGSVLLMAAALFIFIQYLKLI